MILDFGSFTYWLRGVLGPFGYHPDHRNRHQPGSQSRRGYHLQQGLGLG